MVLQVNSTPSITPLDSDSVICGGGMVTGAAPRASTSSAEARWEARSFMPVRSSRLSIALLRVWKPMPPSPCMASTL
ncbi:hypothetical protein D3C71_2171250 [compost metagenome]